MSGINLVNFNRQANDILDKIQGNSGTSRNNLSERITQAEPRAVNGKIQGKKFGSSTDVGEIDARNCNMLLGCMAQMCADNPPSFLKSEGDQSQQARALIAFLKCSQDLRDDLVKNGNFGKFLQQAADMTDEEFNRSDNFKQFLQNYSPKSTTTIPPQNTSIPKISPSINPHSTPPTGEQHISPSIQDQVLFQPLQDPALSQLNLSSFETPVPLKAEPSAEPFDALTEALQNFQSQLERKTPLPKSKMIPLPNQTLTSPALPTLTPLNPRQAVSQPQPPPQLAELSPLTSLEPLQAEPVELLTPTPLDPLKAEPSAEPFDALTEALQNFQ
jgi:hypothetical protein